MNHFSRRAYALPAALLLAAALLLSGCGPAFANDPMTCLSSPPSSVADYRSVFANRSVWSGGDIGATVALPDGRVLWLFGDTLTDGLSATGGMTSGLMRNSIVEQNGNCFSLISIGARGNRSGPLPALEDGEWLWPSSGVIDADGLLRISTLRMGTAAGAQGWEWVVKGVDIVTLTTPDLAWVKTQHAGITQDGVVNWSGGSVTSGGYTYFYGFRFDHQVVARVATSRVSEDPWEFYTTTGWTTDREAAQSPPIDHAPAASFWVIPYKGGYLASAKTNEMNSDDVSTWTSASPTGPWAFAGRAATTAGAGSPYITYSGRVTNLPGAGLTAVWSQNGRNSDPNFDFHNFGLMFGAPLAGSLP